VHLNFEAVWPIHCIRTRQGALIFQRKQKRGNKSERQISKHLKKEDNNFPENKTEKQRGFQARSYVFFLVLLAVSMSNWFPCNMCILQTRLRGSNLIEAGSIYSFPIGSGHNSLSLSTTWQLFCDAG